MLNNLDDGMPIEILSEVEGDDEYELPKEPDFITLERTDELPLRFKGKLMHKYKSRDGDEYELYETDETHDEAYYVVGVKEDSYAGINNAVHLFTDQELCRQFFIQELGAFESLEFQHFLGPEDVQILE